MKTVIIAIKLMAFFFFTQSFSIAFSLKENLIGWLLGFILTESSHHLVADHA